MIRFARSIRIRAPLATLYEFHLNPENARLISPPWQEITRVTLPDEPRAGAEIGLDVKVYGMVQHWRVVWEDVHPPDGYGFARLVDKAIESPFAEFRHFHEFREVSGGVELTDRVEATLPGGFLGRVGEPLMRWDLERMFRYRQVHTKRLLELSTRGQFRLLTGV